MILLQFDVQPVAITEPEDEGLEFETPQTSFFCGGEKFPTVGRA
jgi:hypothetical protein